MHTTFEFVWYPFKKIDNFVKIWVCNFKKNSKTMKRNAKLWINSHNAYHEKFSIFIEYNILWKFLVLI